MGGRRGRVVAAGSLSAAGLAELHSSSLSRAQHSSPLQPTCAPGTRSSHMCSCGGLLSAGAAPAAIGLLAEALEGGALLWPVLCVLCRPAPIEGGLFPVAGRICALWQQGLRRGTAAAGSTRHVSTCTPCQVPLLVRPSAQLCLFIVASRHPKRWSVPGQHLTSGLTPAAGGRAERRLPARG